MHNKRGCYGPKKMKIQRNKIIYFILLTLNSCKKSLTNTCISSLDFEKSMATSREISTITGPKWAIVALTRPGRNDIIERNKNLVDKLKPFASNRNVTALFLSEYSLPIDYIRSWEKSFAGFARVRVVNIAHLGFNSRERYGYKYMCKVFGIDLYTILREYDYYIRCDSDCYLRTLKYDIFEYVESKQIEYGYVMRKLEAHGPTKQLMPIWVRKYLKTCALTAKSMMDYPLNTCFNFYNNFHIGSVHFFLRPDVQHFLSAVNRSGHILSDRWGDSTIQAYAVRIFMKPQNLQQLPDLEYVHGSHSNRLVSSVGDGSKTTVPQRLPHYDGRAIDEQN